MTHFEIFIQNAYKVTELFHVDRYEAELYLGKMLEITFKYPIYLTLVEDKDAAVVGEAYLDLLDAINDEVFYQSLSTLGYYFLSRGLEYDERNYKALSKRIMILNLGARSFYKTIGQALELPYLNTIDFIDWKKFPNVLKCILALELVDLRKLQAKVILPDDMELRKEWLEYTFKKGYFNDICSEDKLNIFCQGAYEDIMLYIDKMIRIDHIVYFRE